MNTQKYYDFINFIFNRDEALGTSWHFDLETDDEDRELQLSMQERIVLIGNMLTNYRTDLAHFSDWQLANGVEFLFNSAICDYGRDICNIDLPLDDKIATILSLKTFYKQCYNERCSPVLSHLNEKGNSELNMFCYMIGDATALRCREIYPLEVNNAILELLRYVLTLDNIACLESGLHWLNHIWEEPFQTQAKKIVDNFIKRYQKKSDMNEELLSYAYCAALGRAQ